MNKGEKRVSERRNRRFVDNSIQGYYLVGLVLLELILFLAALWFVYQFLVDNIEAQLYRFHLAQGFSFADLWPQIFEIFLLVVVVNLVATALMTLVWHFQVRAIILPLKGILGEVNRLDFCDAPSENPGHDLLQKAQIWKRNERKRCENISGVMSKLGAVDPAGQREEISALLLRLKQMLP